MVTHDLPLVAAHMDRAVWVDRAVTAMPASDVTVAGVERLVHGEHGDADAHRHGASGASAPAPGTLSAASPASRTSEP
jgi:hypothetical protein